MKRKEASVLLVWRESCHLCENLLREKLFLWETAQSLDSFSKAGQPNSSRSVLNPLADVFGGPGGSNCVVPPQVSGSVGDEVRDNNIHCGLIRDSDLNTTLRSFWELESIGVKNENCSSEEDVSFEMFKQRVHFKNGRYEVELPWKRDSNELSDNFSLAKRRLGSLMRKMQRDKVLYSEYCKVLKNYLDVE
ncbi:DUF1758 domain-containing protein [Trichonephila clavipes]|nr:DUF1758 domain-containing protein [Trichonephila clavipes]